ncbi:hypothetical protein BJ165DRAFT_1406836 [Panaeolus papilionaceus]|nr:hypothetical protein BJ165DRAFT_1406836 [Panaeolus papilionaceus]
MLPPGPQHLLNTFPSLFGPCIAIGLGFFSLNHFSILRLSIWEIITLSLVLRPLVFAIRNWIERRAFGREAKANGATLPPIVPESSFAIVGKLTESLKSGYPADAMFEYMQQYGDNVIQFNFFGNRMLFTTEPDHFKSLLATQFDAFEKGPSARDIMDSFLGVGIFNSDGRFTLDSASEYLFGHNVDSISVGIPYPSYAAEKNTPSFYNHPANVFQHAFEEGQLRSTYRIGAGDDWRMFEFWKDEVIPRRRVIDSFTEPAGGAKNELSTARRKETRAPCLRIW